MRAQGQGPPLAAALIVGALALAACTAEGVATQDVVATIPWSGPEEAVYRLLDGDETIGRGVLRIEEEGDQLRLSQEFEGQGFRDVAVAIVDNQTLKPREVTRVIDGPDGERRWEVRYVGDVAKVHQRAGDDERDDQLRVPPHAYDKWSEIFLWRTIDFRPGYEAAYTTIIAADLVNPKRSLVTLEVMGKERVQVPAGSFEAWRLEIRQGGQRQTAWFAADDTRELLRYDNGSLVFELEEQR